MADEVCAGVLLRVVDGVADGAGDVAKVAGVAGGLLGAASVDDPSE